MRKALKIWIIVAISLILVGSLIFTGAMAFLDFDFKRLSTEKYETNTYDINETFDKISIDLSISELTFVPSDNGKCKVVCYEKENLKHSVEAEDGTLVIETIDTQKWYDNIGVSFDNMKLTVYLPEKEYTSLFVDTTTGGVEVPKGFVFESITINSTVGNATCYATADHIDINVSTGKIQIADIECESIKANSTVGEIQISDIECDSINAKSTTGKIQISDVKCDNINTNSTVGETSFSEVIAKKELYAKATTGDVTFTNSDADSITVSTSTGDVTGNLLSDKVFVCETSTGDIDIPETTSGGVCEISTTTGDIKFDSTI